MFEETKKFISEHQKLFAGLFILLVVVAVFSIALTLKNSYTSEIDNMSSPPTPLGQRLNQQGWMLFGNKWCPFCKKQQQELGEDMRWLRYIDADDQKSLTIAAGVERFPSWYNTKTNELRVGFKTRYQLYQMSQPPYSATLDLQTAPDSTVRMPVSLPIPDIYVGTNM